MRLAMGMAEVWEATRGSARTAWLGTLMPSHRRVPPRRGTRMPRTAPIPVGPLRGEVLLELVERPGRTHETEARVGEVRKPGVARSGGRASQPRIARKFFTPLEEGHRGWNTLGARYTGTGAGRVGSRYACLSSSQRQRGTIALFVLSGRDRRRPRSDDPGVWEAGSAYVSQQLLLGVLSRQRAGIGRAPSFATRVKRVHREAGASNRSATRPVATRPGTRPGARPAGRPNRQLRTRSG